MKNILALILRYFSFLLCGLLLCAAIYYLYLIDRTVVLTGFSHTVAVFRPPLSAVLPFIPVAATPLAILACFSLTLSFVRKERVGLGEGFFAILCHVATWIALLPACFHFALTLDAPPSLPHAPLNAGYFRPAGPGEIRFFTNVNPDRGFVLNTLDNDAHSVSSFDETDGTTETALSAFSDPLVAERLRAPFWLTALLGLFTKLLQHLRAAYLAGTFPWLFAAAPCLPLSASVVITHLSRRRFSNFCRALLVFLIVIGGNIAWIHFDLDTFVSPAANSLIALLPAPITVGLQNGSPGLALVNLLLALVLYCCGFLGALTKLKSRQKNTPGALS